MITQALTHLATQTACIQNLHTVRCDKSTSSVGGLFGLVFILLGVVMLFVILGLIFWTLSLVHAIRHKDIDNRIIWLIIILLIPLGGIVYFFKVYRPYYIAHPYIPNPKNRPPKP